ncbi:hypothetical protein PVAP13_1KG044200 [Panicum virgatum]|uniref:Uncharacterized protein n=1 Tax=Panicum virgatum TaxID=38727 RepID=A0A8T0XB30_PANVG|nr:hypothetical protein PVAP13_1KG044200 [Panicum virgatum]
MQQRRRRKGRRGIPIRGPPSSARGSSLVVPVAAGDRDRRERTDRIETDSWEPPREGSVRINPEHALSFFLLVGCIVRAHHGLDAHNAHGARSSRHVPGRWDGSGQARTCRGFVGL